MPTTQAHRKIDYLFFTYFLLQIPSTIFFDTQGVYPEWIYPSFLKSLRTHYLESYRDPFLENAWHHPWYLAVCLVEHFIEVPFFFWATYAYWFGALNKPSIVVPSLLYSVHTVTAILSIWSMALLQDFTDYKVPAPRNTQERFKLCSAYAIFFIVSAINAIDCARLLLNKKKRD
ncbi:transmembrane protein 97 [Plakobranchus ocellatus]|uniref:Sigma intracellular receptor 2 n=1 Tax=Plakobranchus ocellatus TaxID=259542 RepID=A0AAV4API5_9GAST|nr:transmembrane protein 97 [Plakobranchus ocellatus]